MWCVTCDGRMGMCVRYGCEYGVMSECECGVMSECECGVMSECEYGAE